MPISWKSSRGHTFYNVKIYFTHKAWWGKYGHKTSYPDQSTYAGVISRDSVCIAFTYAVINCIDAIAADTKNAYLQAPSSDKHYIIYGGEFGLEQIGKNSLIRWALYSGKASGANIWRHLQSCMTHIGFTSCNPDPDIWMW